jgi:AraC-like DNA-binding protein
METLLILGVFEALFIALVLLFKKPKGLPDRILFALFVIYAVTILLSWIELFNRNHGYPYPGFIHTSAPTILLHGPVLWFYIRSLTLPPLRFRPVLLLHFLPFLLILSGFVITSWSLPADLKIELEKTQAFKESWFYPVGLASVFLVSQGYYIWCLILIRRHNRVLRQYFSGLGHSGLRWLTFLLWGAIISYASNSAMYILDYAMGLMPYGLMQVIGYSTASVFILCLGFLGFRQGNVFSHLPAIPADVIGAVPEISTQPLRPGEEVFVSRLLDCMNTAKPYLNPELSLAQLAEKLAVQPDYLSAVLNSRLGLNFFDFVNQYRVEEFKAQLKIPANRRLTLVSLAYDCGFNSKATFNRVFKRVTGLTPSEYQRMSQ